MLKKYALVSFLFFASQNLYSSQARVVTRQNQNSFAASLRSGVSFAWKHPWLCWLSCWSFMGGAFSNTGAQPQRALPLATQLFRPDLPICTCGKAFVYYSHGLYLWAEIPKACKTKANDKQLKKKQCRPEDEELEKDLENPQYRQEYQEMLEAIRKKDKQQGKRPSASMKEHTQMTRAQRPRQKKIEEQAQRLGITAIHLLKRFS